MLTEEHQHEVRLQADLRCSRWSVHTEFRTYARTIPAQPTAGPRSSARRMRVMSPMAALLLFLTAGLAVSASRADLIAYNPAVAERLILLSDATYCGDDQHGGTAPLLSFDCPPCQAAAMVGGVVRSIVIVQNATRQTLSLVGVAEWGSRGDTDTGAQASIVVAFRGSVLKSNFRDDADQALLELPSAAGTAVRAHVHRGMYYSYSSIAAATLAAVARLVASQNGKVREIIVTGHSLGAGQAVFGAYDLAVAHPTLSVVTYSFGTPRPGDLSFARLLNDTSNLHTFAVTHRADTVPQCGIYRAPCQSERALGLHQVSGNIWYPEDMVAPPLTPTEWVRCDGSGEDPNCQDAVPQSALNWRDHNRYLQHSMYCCDAKGNGTAHGKPGCTFPF